MAEKPNFIVQTLSHLLRKKLQAGGALVLNVAQRGNVSRNIVFEQALEKATARFLKDKDPDRIRTHVSFNVQHPRVEPPLTMVDYLCWAV